MPRRNGFLFFIVLVLVLPIVNCSSTPHHKTIPSISGTLPDGFVDVPYTGTLTVTGGVAPYTWNITGLPSTLTFAVSGNTVTISGTPTDTGIISGTATVTDSKMVSSPAFTFTFTIGPTPALGITPTTLPQLTVGTATNQVLTVNPATIGPYTWNITAGPSLPPGLTFSGGTSTSPTIIMTTTTNTVTITGTPTLAGNYPLQITVTDSATPPNTTFVNYTIIVVNSNANACPAGTNNAALPAGTTYAFLLRGFDGEDEPIVIAGSFTADGLGGITAGDVDFNGFTNGPQEVGASLDTADSAYSFDLNNDTRGCLSLVFNTGGAAKPRQAHSAGKVSSRPASARARRARKSKPQGVVAAIPSRVVFQFALGGQTAGVYTTGNIIEFDDAGGISTLASGVMHLQVPADFNVSSLAANFAFSLAGWDSNVNRAAVAGSFANAAGTIGPIFADFNDGGTEIQSSPGGSGAINSVSTTTGRATANFVIPGTATFDSVIYVLNANDFYIISSDAISATVPLLSGRALNTPGTFAAGALNGFFLVAAEGFDAINFTSTVSVGTSQFSSTGNTVAVSLTTNDAGTVTNPAFTGTYAVDAVNPSSGRVAFTGTGTASVPIVYLTSGGDGIEQIEGFSVGTGADVASGVLVTQSAGIPAFTSADIAGSYALGDWEDADGQNGSISGGTTLTAATAATGTYTADLDINFFAPADGVTFLSPGTAFNGPFTINADGTGTSTVPVITCFASPCANTSVFVTNGLQIFAIPTGDVDGILYTSTNVTAP